LERLLKAEIPVSETGIIFDPQSVQIGKLSNLIQVSILNPRSGQTEPINLIFDGQKRFDQFRGLTIQTHPADHVQGTGFLGKYPDPKSLISPALNEQYRCSPLAFFLSENI
jgi:hypothetical protein